MKYFILILLAVFLVQCNQNNRSNKDSEEQYCHILFPYDSSGSALHLCFGKYINLYFTRNGMINGTDIFYRKNGSLLSYEWNSNGKLNGKSYLFWENGQVKHELFYVDGRLEGVAVAYDSLGRETKYSIFKKDTIYYQEEHEFDSLGKYVLTKITVAPYITFNNRQPCKTCPLDFELLLRDKVPVDRYNLRYNIMKTSKDTTFKYPDPPITIPCTKKKFVRHFIYEGPGEYVVYGILVVKKDTTIGTAFEKKFRVK